MEYSRNKLPGNERLFQEADEAFSPLLFQTNTLIKDSSYGVKYYLDTTQNDMTWRRDKDSSVRVKRRNRAKIQSEKTEWKYTAVIINFVIIAN